MVKVQQAARRLNRAFRQVLSGPQFLAELGHIGLIQVTGLMRVMTQIWPLLPLDDGLANQRDVLRQEMRTRPRMQANKAPPRVHSVP